MVEMWEKFSYGNLKSGDPENYPSRAEVSSL